MKGCLYYRCSINFPVLRREFSESAVRSTSVPLPVLFPLHSPSPLFLVHFVPTLFNIFLFLNDFVLQNPIAQYLVLSKSSLLLQNLIPQNAVLQKFKKCTAKIADGF